MTKINQSLPAVLRRRAVKLLDLYPGEEASKAAAAMAAAADELELREHCESDAENVAVTKYAELRRVRRTLASVFEQLPSLASMRVVAPVLEEIEATLRSVPERHINRRMIVVTVGDDATEAFVMEEARAAIEAYFVAKELQRQGGVHHPRLPER